MQRGRDRRRDHGLGREQRGGERGGGPRLGRDRREPVRVERLALEHAAEVEPLHEREHEPVLEGGVQRELQQQVFAGRQQRQLAAAGAPALPQRLAVEREQPRRGGHAAVQLQHEPGARLHQDPRVVRARLSREPGRAQGGRRVVPALEHEQVDVGHRPLRLEVVDGLGERHALERQRTDPREERSDAARAARAIWRSTSAEPFAPLEPERLEERPGPGGPLALERREEHAREPLLAGGREQLGRGGGAFGRGRRTLGHERSQQAPGL